MNDVSIFVANILEVPFSVLKMGLSQYFSPYVCMYKSIVFVDEFLARVLHLCCLHMLLELL